MGRCRRTEVGGEKYSRRERWGKVDWERKVERARLEEIDGQRYVVERKVQRGRCTGRGR